MQTPGSPFRFNDWLVEPESNAVRRGDETRQLEGKAMDLLAYLAANADRVVSTEEILDAVWPGRVVEQSTVHRRINQIRTALGDDPKTPRYVKTIVRRGYQAIGEVEAVTTTACEPEKPGPPVQLATRWPFAIAGVVAALGLVLLLGVSTSGLKPAPVIEWPATLLITVDEGGDMEAARAVRQSLLPLLSGLFYLKVTTEARDPFDLNLRITADTKGEGTDLALSLRFEHWQETIWSENFHQRVPVTRFDSADRVASKVSTVAASAVTAERQSGSASQRSRRLWVRGYATESDQEQRYLLEAAVDDSPDFAIAWGQLLYHVDPRREPAWAREVADTLLRLKPQSGFNQAVAKYLILGELDYAGALEQLDVAERSGDPWGMRGQRELWRGIVAFSRGHLGDALHHLEIAANIPSASDAGPIRVSRAKVMNALGRHDDARRVLEEGLHFYPELTDVSFVELGHRTEQVKSLALGGRQAEANRLLDELWQRFSGQASHRFPHLFALLGRRGEARALLLELEDADSRGVHFPKFHLFEAEIYLDNYESAAVWLEDVIAEHDVFNLGLVRAARYLAPFRTHPGYETAMLELCRIEAAAAGAADISPAVGCEKNTASTPHLSQKQ